MTSRVFNFGAGPAMLPLSVLEKVQEDWLDFQGLGVSIVEISHRSKEFEHLLEETKQRFKALTRLPDNYEILFVHGGAQMQFSAIPLNLIARSSTKKALYVESGYFAKYAITEAQRYGNIQVVASSAGTGYDRLPAVDSIDWAQDAAYVYFTGNNTIVGTQWHSFPDTGEVPIVVDATSDILSRRIDFSKLGVVFAGFQKNLGPAGVALVVIREDLLGPALPHTPKLLNYETAVTNNSLTNTINTFAIYVMNLMLQWLQEQGGVSAIEQVNQEKARCLYDLLDHSEFYRPFAQPEHRSLMNVAFHPPSESLLSAFLKEALAQGLYALKGHRSVGGARASLYNAMPLAGVQTLKTFMETFERRHG